MNYAYICEHFVSIYTLQSAWCIKMIVLITLIKLSTDEEFGMNTIY